MSLSDFEKQLAKEHLRRRDEFNRLIDKSAIEAMSIAASAIAHQRLLAAQALRSLHEGHKTVAAAMFSRPVINSINATHAAIFQNIIKGVDRTALESIARTMASINTSAVAALRRSAVETITALANSTAHMDALASIATLSAAIPRETLKRAAQAVAEAGRIDISKLGAISGSGAIAALDYSSFSPDIEQIRAIQSSFSGQLAVALREMLAAGPITDETARPVLELIDSRIDSGQKGRITAEGLLGLLLALIAVIISFKDYRLNVDQSSSSDKAAVVQEQQLTKISDLLGQVIERINHVGPKEDQNTYYVVEREVILRLKPNTKSSEVALLFRNQKVRLVKPNHQWIYVEYFDEIEAVPKYGWAYKKYLKKLD